MEVFRKKRKKKIDEAVTLNAQEMNKNYSSVRGADHK